MRAALIVGVLLALGCSRRPLRQQAPLMPSTVTPSTAPTPVSPPASESSVVETGSTTLPDPCLPLAAGEVSDDETPSIAGAMARVKAGDWLEARGISRAAFRVWVRSRGPFVTDGEDDDADRLFDADERCVTLKVGDKSEDALACPLVTRTLLTRTSAAVFVVRDKRIVSVLEVGYALPVLAWPSDRRLDLQLTFAPGGLEANLHDRAKPGAVLVGTPSSCHEDYARYLACEKAHRDGVETDPPGQVWCHSLLRAPAEPIELFGCAAALPKIGKFVKENAGDPNSPYTPGELRDDHAFVIKSCAARGRYTWKAGRFVRSSP